MVKFGSMSHFSESDPALEVGVATKAHETLGCSSPGGGTVGSIPNRAPGHQVCHLDMTRPVPGLTVPSRLPEVLDCPGTLLFVMNYSGEGFPGLFPA